MTGIFLLLVIVIWLAIVIWLSKILTEKLPKAWWRIPIAILVFAVLLPLPLIDEIVGGRQFEQLCKEHSSIQVDRAKAVGKTVYFIPQPQIEVKGPWVRVVMQSWKFVDATTGETVVSYNTLQADGGRLIRALGISEGDAPLTFNANCAPTENIKQLFADLNITALDKPTQNQEVK